MKNTIKHIVVLTCMVLFGSCSNDENEVVPDFLDGTEYGILLDVNVTSAKEVSEADLDDYSLNFEVNVKGDKRPVQSIAINKTYVNGEKSTTVQQESLTEFPKTLTLTSSNLVDGFSGLSVADLKAGDSFAIGFVITYIDGRVVDRFDSSMRTNFTVLISE